MSYLYNPKIGFLFDLDGVIVDSESQYTEIWRDIDCAFPTGVENFPIVIKGMALPLILDTYFPARLHGDVVEMLSAREMEMEYPLLPGADALLEDVGELGFPRVLVTSSNQSKMACLRRKQPRIEHWFAHIVTADDIKCSKPDPEGYLRGASLAGVRPEYCVVFEDSLQGVKAGRAAGATVCALTTTLPGETLAPFADIVVRDLSEVNAADIAGRLEARTGGRAGGRRSGGLPGFDPYFVKN